MSKIRIEQQVHVFLAAIKGSRAALADAERAGDVARHAEVSQRLEKTYAEVRRHCKRYGLPLPDGVSEG